MRINIIGKLILVFIFISSNGISQQVKSDKTIDLQISEKVDSIIRALKIPDIRLELSDEDKKNKEILEKYRNKFIARAKEVINQNKIPKNFEFQAYFYGILGAYYIPEREYDKSLIYLNKALEATKSITDNRILYQAQIETYLLSALLNAEKYEDALPLAEKFIEQYKGLGNGALKNAVSIYGVNSYAEAAKKSGVPHEKIEKYLKTISDKYLDEIACAADVQLYIIAKSNKKDTEADQIKHKILTRYPKTPVYTRLYKSWFELD